MSDRLDPDQARHFVGPDLDPICLQRLSADDTWQYRVNHLLFCSYRFLADLMDTPELIRNVTLCGHLHHGKVSISNGYKEKLCA